MDRKEDSIASGSPPILQTTERMRRLVRIGMLSNESNLIEENGEFKVDGDPTEAALHVSAVKAGLDREKEKGLYPQLSIIPIESERGFMATLHKVDGGKVIFAKGAPEKILEMCSNAGQGEALDRTRHLATAEHLAQDGMRVLAMACKNAPEAMEAVRGCTEAGIKMVMITGDHAVTASASILPCKSRLLLIAHGPWP